MKNLDESIAGAMDCDDIALVPWLPYILQDFYEIGSSASRILFIVKENTTDHASLRVLDLGCGKGAVSIRLAADLGCSCRGIDAIPEFIEEARRRAGEEDVAERCEFSAGDARVLVKNLGLYEVIILGSIGPVFGDYLGTLTLLQKNLAPRGIIILDDGYLDEETDVQHDTAMKKRELLAQVRQSGMEMIQEYIDTDTETFEEYDKEFSFLQKRCNELAEKYPEKRNLFLGYVQKQREEYAFLENSCICSTMVLSRVKV
ncbi:class I SAM-dependent methyltransferase [Marispirochaeta sp.]|uniref:SAM-dependent methyltransferase n=1 Tax=Marispirochaeta sp. TaxID=2038653 RepID=UPI0029C7D7D6|nr:class I SAM-dependent methyltransferase [Marispirochaeta sp.]